MKCHHRSFPLCGLAVLTAFLASSLEVQAAAGDSDTTFTTLPLDQSGAVTLALAPDGKIVIGGGFTKVGSAAQAAVARLNADGTYDPTFTMPVGEAGIWFFQAAQNLGGFTIPETKTQGNVSSLVVQSDQKTIIIGNFNRVRNTDRPRIARLHADGTLDPTFNLGTGPDNDLLALQALPNDQVLVGGKFGVWNGVALGDAANRQGIVRLNRDGTRDSSFAFPTDLGGPSSYSGFAPAPGGKVYAIANTAFVATLTAKSRIIRLNPDGTRDTTFTPVELGIANTHLAADASGNGFISGQGVKRFRSDGTEDSAFVQKLGAGTYGPLVFLPDGRMIIHDAIKGLRRVQLDGSPDPAFATKGLLFPVRLLLQPDGKLLVASSLTQPSFAPGLVRFMGDPTGPPTIDVPPASQRVTAGATAVFQVAASGNGPFTYQWQKDGVDIPGATDRVLTLSNAVSGATLRVRVANASGVTPSTEATLTIVPASPGTPYLDGLSRSGADGRVSVLLPSPGGKWIAAGQFGKIDGTTRARVARFEPDGSIDPNFNTSVGPFPSISTVLDAAVQSNGAVVLIGNLSATYANKQHFIIRLTTDGALDTTFAAGPTGVLGASDMFALLALPDDRLLVGGQFSSLMDGSLAPGLFVLNPDGTRNATFNAGGVGFNFSANIQDLALHTNGGVVVATGVPSGLTYNGTPVKPIVRLRSDGTLDAAFNANVPATILANLIAIQPDGRILVASGLDRLNPSATGSRPSLRRLNPDGSLDSGFDTTAIGPADTRVVTAWSFAFQPDQRIVVGGSVSVGGVVRPAVYRLEPNGRFDGTWQVPYAGTGDFAPVFGVGILREGTLLAAGEFLQFGGEPRTNLVVLNTGPFNATVAEPPRVITQTLEQTLTEGANATFSVTPGGTPPFRFQWYFDGKVIPGATEATLVVSNVSVASSGRYACAIVNAGGTNLSNPNRSVLVVNPRQPAAGTNDLSFALTKEFSTARVDAFLTLSSGRVIVGGDFLSRNSSGRYQVVRLNPDASVDTDFSPVTVSAGPNQTQVTGLAEQADGKVLIGGLFNQVNGVAKVGLARLNADGSLDGGYTAGTQNVGSLAIQPDGKVIVISRVGFSGATGLRLNADGTVDSSFALPSDIDARRIHPLSDGRLLVSGQRIVRDASGQTLRADAYGGRHLSSGVADPSFVPSVVIESIYPALDGRLLVSGHNLFNDLSASNARQIARLNSDGSVDSTFTPQQAALSGNSFQALNDALALPDGGMLVAGYFDVIGNSPQAHSSWHLARLGVSGAPDPTFRTYLVAPASLPAIARIGLTTDGKILALQGGVLTRLFNGPSVAAPAGLVISAPSFVANGLAIQVGTTNGRTYLLEFKVTLNDVAWQTVATATGDGTTKTLTHSVAPGGSGFYRIRVQ